MTFTEALELTKAIPELEKTAAELKPFYDNAEEFMKVASEEDFAKEILREQAHIKIAGVSEDKLAFQRAAIGAYEYEKVAGVLQEAYNAKENLEKFESENGEGSVHQEVIKEAELQEQFANLPVADACKHIEEFMNTEKNAAFAETVSYINTADPAEVLELL